MSTTATIIIIAVAVLLLLAILALTVFSPRKREERRLKAERERAAEHHRTEARQREERATVAEQRAEEARLEADRVAQEARMEREQASLHESRADLHERGLADDEFRSDTDGRTDLTSERDATIGDDRNGPSRRDERSGDLHQDRHLHRNRYVDGLGSRHDRDDAAVGHPQLGPALHQHHRIVGDRRPDRRHHRPAGLRARVAEDAAEPVAPVHDRRRPDLDGG